MNPCINTLTPMGRLPLPRFSPSPLAGKVRRITLFAANPRTTFYHRAAAYLNVQFAETAFTPAIRTNPNK